MLIYFQIHKQVTKFIGKTFTPKGIVNCGYESGSEKENPVN